MFNEPKMQSTISVVCPERFYAFKETVCSKHPLHPRCIGYMAVVVVVITSIIFSGAVVIAKAIAKVHPVHRLMNAD